MPVLSGPLLPFVPLQSPLALHEVGLLVADHVSVDESPTNTEVGLAANVTTGRAAVPVPVDDVAPTLTVANPVPVLFLQVNVKI